MSADVTADTDFDLLDLNLIEIAQKLRAGEITSAAITAACLERITTLDATINSFIHVDADGAMAQAETADRKRKEGAALGPLHGVPLAHKDMFYRAGVESTCGSAIRRGWKPDVTATVLQRLDQAGAITLGRLNMSEFAVGPIGLNTHYGPTRNPWNPEHVSGGSSSGPAAAVAAGLCYGALGSDTGASIRVPASACGIAGLKPTFGLISRSGVMQCSSSLDVVGPLARSVADVALLTEILAGADAADPATLDAPPYVGPGDVCAKSRLRIGLPKTFYTEGLDPDIERRVAAVGDVLSGLGHEVRRLALPGFEEAVALYPLISGPEVASFHGPWLRERSDQYSPQVRARLVAGLLVPAARYIDAIRRRGQLLAEVIESIFCEVDVILAPTWLRPVPTIEEVDVGDGPDMMRVLSSILRPTQAINVLGLPALAVPAGFTPNGLPIGVQMIGRPWSDALLLALGKDYQDVTDWHLQRPPVAD
jgi:aspartyl-tRNA(Asn)/glutamyl-tRNA(Gln) amidotransferase subunit A